MYVYIYIYISSAQTSVFQLTSNYKAIRKRSRTLSYAEGMLIVETGERLGSDPVKVLVFIECIGIS